MYAVGIDVSKDESTVAVIQPFGVVIAEPYKVRHTETYLRKLADYLKSLPGETKVIMEYTGRYYEPIARCLHNEGIFFSVVNAILIANYNENITVRKVKTDPKDALKIANWGIDRWLKLPEYIPAEDSRQKLKLFNHQYIEYSKVRTMLKNNFIRQKIESAFDGFFIAFAPFFESREYHRNMLHGNVYPWNSLLCITCLFICGRNNIMNNSLQIHCIYFIESIL